MGPNRARLALLLAGGRPLPARAFAGGKPLGRRVGESSSLDELRLEERKSYIFVGENNEWDGKDFIFIYAKVPVPSIPVPVPFTK